MKEPQEIPKGKPSPVAGDSKRDEQAYRDKNPSILNPKGGDKAEEKPAEQE